MSSISSISETSISPRLLKAAIVFYESSRGNPKVITFQYNPDTLTRSLEPQTSGEGADPAEVLRLTAAPREIINVDIELDATDQLEHPDQNTIVTAMGIYPQLAALEVLTYPKSSTVVANNMLASQGIIEIIGPEGPFIVFIFGPRRVVPVRITKFDITEEAYDINLNPIRAKVSLGLRVLTYDDFSPDHPGYSLFLSYQQMKESMAVNGSTTSLDKVGVGKII